MKKTYVSPQLFQYGEFTDVVQHRFFSYYRWDIWTKRRYWLPG